MPHKLAALEAAVEWFDQIQVSDKSENCMEKPGFEEVTEMLWASLPLTNPPDLVWLAGYRVDKGRKYLVDMQPGADDHVREILILGRGHSGARLALHLTMESRESEHWRLNADFRRAEID